MFSFILQPLILRLISLDVAGIMGSHSFIRSLKGFDKSTFVGVVYIIGGVLWSMESLWSIWAYKTVRPSLPGFRVYMTFGFRVSGCGAFKHHRGFVAQKSFAAVSSPVKVPCVASWALNGVLSGFQICGHVQSCQHG